MLFMLPARALLPGVSAQRSPNTSGLPLSASCAVANPRLRNAASMKSAMAHDLIARTSAWNRASAAGASAKPSATSAGVGGGAGVRDLHAGEQLLDAAEGEAALELRAARSQHADLRPYGHAGGGAGVELVGEGGDPLDVGLRAPSEERDALEQIDLRVLVEAHASILRSARHGPQVGCTGRGCRGFTGPSPGNANSQTSSA